MENKSVTHECIFALQAVQMKTRNVTAPERPRGFNISLMFGGFKKEFSKRFYFHIHKYSSTYAQTANKYFINYTGLWGRSHSLRVTIGQVTICSVIGGSSSMWEGDDDSLAATPVWNVRRVPWTTCPHGQPAYTNAACSKTQLTGAKETVLRKN